MSAGNRIVINIEESKLDLEETIETKLDEIKFYHMKNINYLDMKIPAITSNKTSSYYEQPSADIKNGHP